MLYISIGAALCLLLFIGCQSAPRYSSTSKEQPRAIKSKQLSSLTTNDNMRLGSILQRYLGRPYKGRSKTDPGLDCSLFTSEVFKKYNQTNIPRSANDQFQIGKKVKNKNLYYGDLVFFKINSSKISHVGIYLDNNKFIHASSSNGIIISSLREKYWSKYFVGAKRVIGN